MLTTKSNKFDTFSFMYFHFYQSCYNKSGDFMKKRKETRMSRRRKKIWNQRFWIIAFLIAVLILGIGLLKIYGWQSDNKKTDKVIKKIEEAVKVTKVEKTENEKLINEPKDKNDDYWNYIKLPLIDVNFQDLKEKNTDTVAFLKVNGTNINYPVVQTKDNDYYLTHSYDKTKNDAGWVFMDYRNQTEPLDKNTIIYAHGRWNTTMFGSLKNVFKNSWYKNTDNYVVYLSTPTYNSLWQVFSIYKIKTETYYLTTNFGSTSSYQKFLNTMKDRSAYSFQANLNTDDKILTLSTCYNDSEKVVLHAKLIKEQKK